MNKNILTLLLFIVCTAGLQADQQCASRSFLKKWVKVSRNQKEAVEKKMKAIVASMCYGVADYFEDANKLPQIITTIEKTIEAEMGCNNGRFLLNQLVKFDLDGAKDFEHYLKKIKHDTSMHADKVLDRLDTENQCAKNVKKMIRSSQKNEQKKKSFSKKILKLSQAMHRDVGDYFSGKRNDELLGHTEQELEKEFACTDGNSFILQSLKESPLISFASVEDYFMFIEREIIRGLSKAIAARASGKDKKRHSGL